MILPSPRHRRTAALLATVALAVAVGGITAAAGSGSAATHAGAARRTTGPALPGAPSQALATGTPASAPAPVSGLTTSLPAGTGQLPEPAAAAPYDPCPGQDGAVAGDGPSITAPVTIPALPATPLPGPAAQFDPQPGDVPATFAGTILRPADTDAYPGARPVVVLFHGIGGDQCQMWWLAQYLAGVGYVAVTLTSPTPATHDASYGVAIDAARSAVAFLQEPFENPLASFTDGSEIGLAGWSEGSVVVSVAQGLPGMGAVRAIVALDDLRGSFLGDTGAPLTFCSPPVKAVVTPRVPALGFASDTACDVEAADTSPGIKLSGFDRWRHDDLPSVELPLAGYDHFDYDDTGPRLLPLAQLTKAWFDRWVVGQREALSPFISCQLDGIDFPALLSSTFRSAAFLPELGIDSTTWARTLAARCGQDPAEIGSSPVPGGPGVPVP